MSRASQQRWFDRRSVTRLKQHRRVYLLVVQPNCVACDRRLHGVDHNAVDFACLVMERDLLYCRGCISAGAHLPQVAWGAVQ